MNKTLAYGSTAGNTYMFCYVEQGSNRSLLTDNTGTGNYLFDRGFTGHCLSRTGFGKHLDAFKLINMNGRLYDPILGRMLSPDNFVQSTTNPQSYNRYSYCLNNPLVYVDPEGEFITWNINNNGFSIGFNLTPIGIPLGAGINIGYGNGFSLGGYGEVGYRVGGTGLGSGATISQSIDYNFANNSCSTTTSEGAYASFGPFNVGASLSQSYNITNNQWSYNWGVSAGIGIGNPQAGIGLNVGYGSGGWSYGVGGYYNPFVKPYYEANLEDYENIPQGNSLNCKNAILAAIEKMNGGTRDQSYFEREGNEFILSQPLYPVNTITLQEYFEYFGFNVTDAKGLTYMDIGDEMKHGNPTVINEYMGGPFNLSHTITILRIRQWKQTSNNIKVWFSDPACGTRIKKWNTTVGNNNFNKGSYLFLLH